MKGYLHDLIAQGEHQQQDFKFKVDDAPKLARSVSAFANTDGGRLLIGVRDDGSIHGVRSEEEIYMMHAAAYKFCTPVPTLKFETLQVATAPHEGRKRTVVICTVMPSEHRPVMAIEDGRQTAYVRVADENIVASPVHLAIWRQEAHLRGEAYSDTAEEHALLTTLNEYTQGMTLNTLVRASKVARPLATALMARFIRFGLANMERREGQWWFTAPE